MATTISDQQAQQTNTTLEEICNCRICFGIIQGASITRCGHRFCRQCIEQWLEYHPNCPVCREFLLAAYLIRDYTFDEIVDELPKKSKELDELQKGRKRLEQQCQGMKKELRYLEDKLIPNIDAFSKDLLSNHDAAKWKIKQLDQEIERLRSFEQLCRDKDDELKKINPIKQAQLDTLGERILKLKAEDAAQRDQIETLRNKIKSLELELAKTAKEQKQTLDEKRRISADLQKKNRDLAEVQTSTERLNKQCSTLTSELQHMKDELIPSKDTIIKRIERQNSDLQNDVQSKREKLTELEMCKKNLELQCKEIRTELRRLQQEVIPNKDADIKKINQENADLQSTNAAQKGQIETLRCKEESLELKIGSRNEENKQILDYNRRILDELQNKREELEKLQTSKKNLGLQAKTLRKELQHFKELLPKKDTKIEELQAANAIQQYQKESIELKLVRLTEEHQQTLNENRHFSDDLHRQRKEITELETYRENLKQRCQELWTELQQKEEAMSDENTKLQSDLQSKCGELVNMEQQCQKLKVELKLLKEEVIPNKDRLIEKIRRNNSCIDFTKLFLMVVFLGVCFGFLRVWFSVPLASLYVL